MNSKRMRWYEGRLQLDEHGNGWMDVMDTSYYVRDPYPDMTVGQSTYTTLIKQGWVLDKNESKGVED
ncbi:MAG: hypothetical protein ACRDEA_08970 [Microcystaceae cyanobacterium]